MKLLWVLLFISFSSAGQTKIYRFIGKLQESDFADGYFWYTFVGVNGKSKVFIQVDDWDTLDYDFERTDLYQDKWFEIHYYGVYDAVGDDEEKFWFRRIKSVSLIPRPGLKHYYFTGQFKSASVLEGSGHYTFIGLNGKPKEFAHDIDWLQPKIPYNLLDGTANTNQSYLDKWFRIVYHGVFGVLSGEDGGTNKWHRKIYTIELVPVPPSKDVAITDTSRLFDFRRIKGIANFAFQDGPNSYMETKCDSSTLAKFPFDFSDERAFAEKYYEHRFSFQYRIEYELETDEPVIRKLLSLEIVE